MSSQSITILGNILPAPSAEALEKIIAVESAAMQREQLHFQTEHVIHAGMYARTVRLKPGTLIVGALIKIPTILVVHGCAIVFAGDQWYRIDDYQVIPASAGRKQIFVALATTEITMMFPTKAMSVSDAEQEFTDEMEKLVSRRDGDDDIIVITGVQSCQG